MDKKDSKVIDAIIDKYTDRYKKKSDFDVKQRVKDEQEAWEEKLGRISRVWNYEEDNGK